MNNRITLENNLVDCPVSGLSSTLYERETFHDLLGQETTCTNSVMARSVEFFSLAFMVTLVFLFFQIPAVEDWLTCYVPDYYYRLFTKALLFFVIVYILDRISIFIRDEIDICDFRDY